MMAVRVLFAFPQTLQAFVIPPVNSVVYGAIPIIFAHRAVGFRGVLL